MMPVDGVCTLKSCKYASRFERMQLMAFNLINGNW